MFSSPRLFQIRPERLHLRHRFFSCRIAEDALRLGDEREDADISGEGMEALEAQGWHGGRAEAGGGHREERGSSSQSMMV